MAIKSKKPRKYTKKSPHWNETSKEASKMGPLVQTKGTTRLDNYITDLEQMTGHKFTPTEIMHVVATSKKL